MQIPNLSAFAVRERAVTLFLIIAVAAAGLFAFQRLGRAEDPSFTVKVMTVAVAWPGATAAEMQEQVADKLEKRLQEVAYFDRVETTSRPGQVAMVISFKDTTPPKLAPELFYQVRKKLSDEASNLPRGVIGPFFNDEFSDVYFTLYAMEARGLPHRDLVREAEAVRQRLLAVPGVQKVRILGEQPQRIYVEFSHTRLATLGLSGQQVANALSSQNTVAAAGFVETDGPRVHMRLDGEFDSLETLRETPVAAVGDRTLRLRDVAEVRRGYEDPPSYRIRNAGEPALLIGVVMQPRWNGLRLGEALAAEERAIHDSLPLGLELHKIADQARNIANSYDEFMLKFAVALGVVMAVSFATLGLRVGLVVAAAVPLTLAVVFVIMLATGRNFDRITLGALILSLGLLVDDAIIAIEMMVVKMEEGLDRISAATFSWTATAAPMLTGTLVTIIGFIPIGFAQSSAGEYAGNIFWIVAFALLASWLVAVLFTPYLGVKLLPAIPARPGGHDAIYATDRYERLRRLIRACIDRRRTVIGLTVAAFALSVAAMGVVKKQFFPSSDRPEVLIEVALPQGSSFRATEATIARLEADLRREPEAEIVTSYIGAGAARFFLSLNPEQPDPAFGKIVIRTPDAKARAALSAKVARWVEAGRYLEARIRVDRLLFGPPVPYPVVFRVVGTDLAVMRRTATAVRDVLQAAPELKGAHLEWGERAPVQRLAFDQARLRLIGLTPQDAANQLQTLLTGVTVTQVREGIRTVDVVARAVDAERASLDRLGDLTLTTRDGRSVALAQVARLVPAAEEPVLKRRNRELYIAVRADVAEGIQPPDATAAVLPRLATLKASLPPGVRIDTGGSVEESGKANAALAAIFPIMITLMLAVIMAQVRSFPAMFMVFLTAPLGLVGAAPTLLLFNQPFGFNAILGLIGLAGILMRNTLILVDQIRRDQAAGLSDYDAIVEATVRRARPVILTALAAMLAFIPLTLSSFWGPLAYTLIGGVLIGTVLTLLFLPALYAAWFRVRRPGEPGAARTGFPASLLRRGSFGRSRGEGRSASA
ncbi:MAG: efflux RND transporter permease subunit [Phenylobacterium sp.]|uniref:efflux RND transporter permease subunit n=1 Tax=Phenylobacterium sp. TaxID=1871053 RepID=UPI001A400EF0|nr:efflux RND transporter permease subunit [Phenylobacterium sp.]MBL8771370.1 efflux RND transporter permease subunit [Phenylobacterium sp.]